MYTNVLLFKDNPTSSYFSDYKPHFGWLNLGKIRVNIPIVHKGSVQIWRFGGFSPLFDQHFPHWVWCFFSPFKSPFDHYFPNPICSMYGIFTNICPRNHPNIGKYTIHGAYGNLFSLEKARHGENRGKDRDLFHGFTKDVPGLSARVFLGCDQIKTALSQQKHEECFFYR